MKSTFPPLPVIDLRDRTKGSDDLAQDIRGIATETRFIVRYKCSHPRCKDNHKYIVTARRHDPDALNDGKPGLWCDDCVDTSDNTRDNMPMCITYEGRVLFHNRLTAISLYGVDKAMATDPVEGDFTESVKA